MQIGVILIEDGLLVNEEYTFTRLLNFHTITQLSHDYSTFTRLLNFHTITVDIHTNTFLGTVRKRAEKAKMPWWKITPPGHSAYCNRVKEVRKAVDIRAFSSKGGERKILTQL